MYIKKTKFIKGLLSPKKIFYAIFITLLITEYLIFIMFLNNYEKINNQTNNILKETKQYKILKKNKIEYSNDTKKLKELEKEFQKKYNNNNLKELEELFDKVEQQNQQLKIENTTLEGEINKKNQKKQELEQQLQEKERIKQERLRIEEEEKERASTFQIQDVITISQFPNYPTGCESAALAILLKYNGINIDVSTIVNSLPKGGYLYYKDNVRYGGNPNIQFVGDPTDVQSFGVYEGPIINVANQYKSGVINATGSSLNSILEIVKQNRPVMVWSTINLLRPYVAITWLSDTTGETINWYAHEHAVVIIGFSNKTVIISDPYSGTIKKQNRVLFEEIYNKMGRKSIYY